MQHASRGVDAAAIVVAFAAFVAAFLAAFLATFLAALAVTLAATLIATLPDCPCFHVDAAHRIGRFVAFDHQLATSGSMSRRVILDHHIEARTWMQRCGERVEYQAETPVPPPQFDAADMERAVADIAD